MPVRKEMLFGEVGYTGGGGSGMAEKGEAGFRMNGKG